MRLPPAVRDTLNQLAVHNIAARIERGRHHKVYFTNTHGHRCLLIVSQTPSDRRAFQKNRSVLRRLLRKGGHHETGVRHER